MITRDEVREVLRTLPDDYLSRYVNAYETRQLSCFPSTLCTACAVTVMSGAGYIDGHLRFVDAGLDSRTVERFYEDIPNNNTILGINATPLYDECVLELARRADVAAAVGVT